MSDKHIQLSRRRVLGGVATIGAASAAVGAGTFAAFSDTAESSDNTIQAGTLELGDTKTVNLDETNIVPGDPVEFGIETEYSGDPDATISLDAINLSDPDDDDSFSGEDFADYLEVDEATLRVGEEGAEETTDTDLTSEDDATLADLATTVNDSGTDELEASDGDPIVFTLGVTFVDEEDQNDAQGQGVNIGVTFAADQA